MDLLAGRNLEKERAEGLTGEKGIGRRVSPRDVRVVVTPLTQLTLNSFYCGAFL